MRGKYSAVLCSGEERVPDAVEGVIDVLAARGVYGHYGDVTQVGPLGCVCGVCVRVLVVL